MLGASDMLGILSEATGFDDLPPVTRLSRVIEVSQLDPNTVKFVSQRPYVLSNFVDGPDNAFEVFDITLGWMSPTSITRSVFDEIDASYAGASGNGFSQFRLLTQPTRATFTEPTVKWVVPSSGAIPFLSSNP